MCPQRAGLALASCSSCLFSVSRLPVCELQVVSLLGDRGGRTAAKAAALPPAPDAAAAAAAAATNLPVWLVHWRLRAALSSQQLFTELFIELSEAAAKCYSQCGHLRNAALLRADVADALVKAGQLERAAELYGRQCRTFLRWGNLAPDGYGWCRFQSEWGLAGPMR